MKKTFLYRLFRYSKWGFVLVSAFIIYYAILFYKKMDTVFSPYNSMFAIDFEKNYTSTTYLVKMNSVPVNITHQPYWKKDFLEESLYNFSKYRMNHNNVFMDYYLDENVADGNLKKFLTKRLVPVQTGADQWLPWYISFAGNKIPAGAIIELWKYDFIFENNHAVVKDSLSIYKTFYANAQ